LALGLKPRPDASDEFDINGYQITNSPPKEDAIVEDETIDEYAKLLAAASTVALMYPVLASNCTASLRPTPVVSAPKTLASWATVETDAGTDSLNAIDADRRNALFDMEVPDTLTGSRMNEFVLSNEIAPLPDVLLSVVKNRSLG